MFFEPDPCMDLTETLARLDVAPDQAAGTLETLIDQARDILRGYGRYSPPGEISDVAAEPPARK